MLGLKRRRVAQSAGGPFDPSSLTLTGWWRAPYSASPWVGNASGGASGSRNLSDATAPTAGTALNGYAPASFTAASSQRLNNALTPSSYFTTTAGSFVILLNVRTAPAAVSNDLDPKIFSDSPSICALMCNSSGVRLYNGGGPTTTPYVTPTMSTWAMIRGKWDGSNMSIGLNQAAFQSTASAGYSSLNGTMRVGANYNQTSFFDGLIAEIIFANTVLSTANFDSIRGYFNTRYALAL